MGLIMADRRRFVKSGRPGGALTGERSYDRGMERYSSDRLVLVINLARAVLKDLEPGEVPHTLRKVRAATGRKLPAPLSRLLLRELDTDEWLRGKAAEHFVDEYGEEEEGSSDTQTTAAALFLLRPPGWEEGLADQGLAAAEQAESQAVAALRKKLDDKEKELAAAHDKERTLRKQVEHARSEASRKAKEAREAAYRERDSHLETIQNLGRAKRDVTARLQAKEARLTTVEGRLDTAREEVRKAREEVRDAREEARDAAGSGINPWGDLDELERARILDEVAAAFRPPPEFDEESLFGDGRGKPELPGLPAGINPEKREAVEWLLTRSETYVLLVDGYNLAFKLHSLRSDDPDIQMIADLPKARRQVDALLARYRRKAANWPQVVVVYDSRATSDLNSYHGHGGIQVKFTAQGLTADDWLLQMATDLGKRSVVVSSDRQVREGAMDAGGLAVWSEAMAAWMLDLKPGATIRYGPYGGTRLA